MVTNYLYYWSADLLKMASRKGMNVFDLEGEKVTRTNFASYLRKHAPEVVFVNGHGNTTTITGDGNRPILDINDAVKTIIIYARSCDAAAVLGKVLVNKGTRAFIGYKRKFTFMYSPVHITKPLKDPIARLFLEPSNLALSTVLKNHTAQEAHIRSREAMFKNFRRMVSSQSSEKERYAARWLWANINSQVLLGDPDARL